MPRGCLLSMLQILFLYFKFLIWCAINDLLLIFFFFPWKLGYFSWLNYHHATISVDIIYALGWMILSGWSSWIICLVLFMWCCTFILCIISLAMIACYSSMSTILLAFDWLFFCLCKIVNWVTDLMFCTVVKLVRSDITKIRFIYRWINEYVMYMLCD